MASSQVLLENCSFVSFFYCLSSNVECMTMLFANVLQKVKTGNFIY